MRPLSHRRNALLLLVTLLVSSLVPPLTAIAEDSVGRGKPDPKDPVLAPRTPVVRTPAVARPTAPMRLQARPAADAAKTEHFIDGGLGRPAAPLTARERAKLEAARVAIAAARANGGLMAPVVQPLDLESPLHSVEAQQSAKFERLRLAQPTPVSSDAAKRGLPAVLTSRQKQGPRTPSARELEKLQAQPTSRVTPEAQKESER